MCFDHPVEIRPLFVARGLGVFWGGCVSLDTKYRNPMKKTTAATVDSYIADFPQEVRKILEQVRLTIAQTVPQAEERISYGIPTFTLHGTYLIYFAGYKNHFSLYPVPGGSESFAKKLAPYRKGKGTLQFPLDKPVPVSLITSIVKMNLKENKARSAAKKKR